MSPRELRDAWLELAERHLAAADLLVQDLPDAAYFHVYHAFECAVTARLLDLDPSMPPAYGHGDRIAWSARRRPL